MSETKPRLRERFLRASLRSLLGLPEPARRWIRGPTRRNDRGDPLEPDVQLLVRLEGLQKAVGERQVAASRAAMRASVQVVEGPPRPLASIDDRALAGRPARVYVPGRQGPLPVMLYLHGGGWTVGDLRSHDRTCQRLAHEVGQIVVSLDYRLAPEHPYPQGLEDALAALLELRTLAPELGGDPARVAIGGDSAGGNLAAAACLLLRDRGLAQPAFQLLVYPATDLRCVSESYRKLGHGYILTQESIQWYLRQYRADPLDPRASVLLEPDLAGLAPAIVVSAGFDPLRDDGEGYAARLRSAGVEVDEIRLPGTVHGFFAMDGVLASAEAAWRRISGAVERRWAAGSAKSGAGA